MLVRSYHRSLKFSDLKGQRMCWALVGKAYTVGVGGCIFDALVYDEVELFCVRLFSFIHVRMVIGGFCSGELFCEHPPR